MIRTGPLFRAFAASPVQLVERDAEGRVWTQLFPLGKWARKDFPGGEIDLTPDLFGAFIANWKAGGRPALPVDYEHKEDGPASGWIEDLRIGPSGELQGAVKWTDDAAGDIKADRRRYLSPTWAMQHVNRRTGEKGGPWLYGAALTNTPFFDSMPRVAASAAGAAQSPTSTTEALAGQEKRMDKKRICAALGLPEDSGDEAVMTAIEAACKARASAADVEGKLTAAVKVTSDLDAKLKASEAELTKLRAERLTEQVDAAIAAGKAEGKALDALAESIKLVASTAGLDAAKKLIAGVAPSVPLDTVGTGGSSAPIDAKDAQKKLEALADEKVKAGMKPTEAWRAACRENRALAEICFPTTSTTNP